MANVFNLTGGGGGGTGIQLKSIKVTKQPQTEYKVGESFKTDNMEVTATYSNDATKVVTGYTYQPSGTLREQDTTITITYAEDGKTASTTVTIHVTRTEIPIPTQNGTLTYDGTPKTVGWNNYDPDKMTISGSQEETEAGTYTVTFTPKEAYCWPQNDTESKQVQWVITQAQGSITLVPSEVTLSPGHTTENVTITKTGDGDISIDNKSTDIVTAILNDAHNQITVTSVNSSSGQASITVTLATGKNYLGTSVTLNVSAAFWEWGDENGEADETWWAGLSNYLQSNSGSSLEAVGKTKKVTLTSSVLGTTSHLIRCIGADQDAPNTLAFQTKNCLNDYTTFSSTAWSSSNSTAAKWTDSNCKAKKECDNYLNAFPGKDYILELERGTCPNISTGSSRNDNVTYNKEKVFLLSEREFGLDTYSPLSTKNSSESKAECTKGKNFSYAYYTDNSKRIMGKGDSSSGTNGYPWERSRYYNHQGTVCFVGNGGTADHNSYSVSYGLAPAFVVGKNPT